MKKMKQIVYVEELSSQSANRAVYLEHRLTAPYQVSYSQVSSGGKSGRKEMQGLLEAWVMLVLVLI